VSEETAAAPSGILLVDKPAGMTSHDVVARVRRLGGTRKVGHAGTLDPAATGLLVLGVGSATRLLTYLVGLDKRYAATIRLGVGTDSDDADGTETSRADASAVPDAAVVAALAAQTGERDQVPSTVSAIKVAGRRAYDLARAGERVELAARRITISAIDVRAVRRDGPTIDVDVVVDCSSGTYIRAIARDLGLDLGVGGHLTALRRERVGPFGIADAGSLDDALVERMLSPAAVARALFPVRELDPAEAVALAQGKRVPAGAVPDAGPIAAIAPDGRLVGLAERRGDTLRTLVNLPTDEVAPR
jgi:tRNA pseudouridine55 synthase